MDTFSKSDPEVEVYLKDLKMKAYTFIGKTETIWNNLNPEFTKNFTIDYFFEREQYLMFKVYDNDGGSERDHIGDCETTVSRVMGSRRQTFEGDLTLTNDKAKKSRGKMVVKADALALSNNDVIISVSARLNSIGAFCCNTDNPYLLISRARPGFDDYIRVHQTSSVPGSTNPVFKIFKLKI